MAVINANGVDALATTLRAEITVDKSSIVQSASATTSGPLRRPRFFQVIQHRPDGPVRPLHRVRQRVRKKPQ